VQERAPPVCLASVFRGSFNAGFHFVVAASILALSLASGRHSRVADLKHCLLLRPFSRDGRASRSPLGKFSGPCASLFSRPASSWPPFLVIFRSVHSLQTSFFGSALLSVAVVSPAIPHFTALSSFIRSVVAQLARRPLFSGPCSVRVHRPVFVRAPCGGSGLGCCRYSFVPLQVFVVRGSFAGLAVQVLSVELLVQARAPTPCELL
jgi:hypothetical protein